MAQPAYKSPRLQAIAVALVSVALAVVTAGRPDLISPLEAVSCVAYAWSVWLLAYNHPSGWFVGLIGVGGYAVVFYEAKLFGETYLQVFYFVTSLQAIWIWMRERDGDETRERPVRGLPRVWWLPTAAVLVVGTLAMRQLLTHQGDAAPFWDALTTAISLVAHVLLMLRYTESWYLWVTVDLIYVPLYAWRELYVTSGLFAVLLVMAGGGLLTFLRLQRENEALAGATERPA
jgi:nicotinamide mononucleotide transporter